MTVGTGELRGKSAKTGSCDRTGQLERKSWDNLGRTASVGKIGQDGQKRQDMTA